MKECKTLKSNYAPTFYNPQLSVTPEKNQKDFITECIAMLNKSESKQIIIETNSDKGNKEPNKWICTVKSGRVAKTYDDLEFKLISL